MNEVKAKVEELLPEVKAQREKDEFLNDCHTLYMCERYLTQASYELYQYGKKHENTK